MPSEMLFVEDGTHESVCVWAIGKDFPLSPYPLIQVFYGIQLKILYIWKNLMDNTLEVSLSYKKCIKTASGNALPL